VRCLIAWFAQFQLLKHPDDFHDSTRNPGGLVSCDG